VDGVLQARPEPVREARSQRLEILEEERLADARDT
jgi:hypothetical protein